MANGDVLIRVVCPGERPFVAGLLLRNDICVHAAPILGWTKGKSRAELREAFKRRGWTATVTTDMTPRRMNR
jgi:hypothetical protein